jgi:PHD/YefM family antitoxin component YafN of YafNO toxin-antitoxin module
MIKLQDIRSLTDFQRNTRAYLRRLKQSRRPTVLTVNGKAELIVQDAEAFEEMLDTIRGVQRGLDEMKAGSGEPAEQVLRRTRMKRRTPRSAQPSFKPKN